MTISSTTTQTLTTCNGTTTNFAFANKIFGASDLVVTLIDTSGNLYAFTSSGVNTFTNATTGLSYTVYNIDVDAGCFIVFSSTPTNLWQLDMRTAIGELQSTSIKNQASFYPELHEEFFDRITREMQDLRRLTYTYGIHGADIESTAWTQLPSAKTRANLLLGFDSNGLPTTATNVSQALTQSLIGQFLYPQTAAEIAAGVTPTNYAYATLNVLRYGADPTGSADSTTAINNAILVARVNGGLVYLPSGTYKTSGSLIVGDYSGVWIKGNGVGITIIQPTSALGSNPVISFGSSTGALNQGFYDLSILCANAPSSTGVSVYAANGFWAENFLIQQASIGMLITGGVIQFYNNWQINRSSLYGVQITGTGSGGNDQYFSDGVMSNVGYIQAGVGINIQASGGVWLSNLDIISQGIGLLLDPSTNQVVEWLFAVNVAFDTCSQAGVLISPSNNGAVNGCDFTACWSSSSSGTGFTLGGTTSGTNPYSATIGINGVRLNGTRVFNNQGHGIVLSANNLLNTSISNCDIAGNSAPIGTWSATTQYSLGNIVLLSGTYYIAAQASLNQSPPNATYWTVLSYATSHGIYVSPGVGSFSINNNRIGAEAGQTATQAYAVIVNAGSANNYSIIGNDVRGNINTPAVSDAGTGTTKIVHSNLGQSPPGSTAITVGTSPFSYPNNTGAPIAVHVAGGTVSAITIETQGTGGIVSGQFTVPQGASITVTYSALPTMITYGLL